MTSNDEVTVARSTLGDWARMVGSFERYLTDDTARSAANALAKDIALVAVEP